MMDGIKRLVLHYKKAKMIREMH